MNDPASAWNIDSLKEHLNSLIETNDRRYGQRFDELRSALLTQNEAQQAAIQAALAAAEKAVTAAFAAQQTAMQTALTSAEKAVNAALEAAERAVLKAEAASEKRFEGVNEFRETLADQQRTLLPRAEAEIRFHALDERLAQLATRQDKSEGAKSGSRDGWGWAVAAISLVVTLLAFASRFLVK